jgi:hypothetical protein
MKGLSSILNTYPFSSPWVRSWVAKWLLPMWFSILSLGHLLTTWFAPGFGTDVRVYRLAAEMWLAGGDPWSAAVPTTAGFQAVQFAAPPPSLIPFALTLWVPTNVLILVVLLASCGLVFIPFHRLHLPAYWLLFPPVFDAIWVGNLNTVVVALLLIGGPAAVSLASLLKVYALVPPLALRRYRDVALGLLVLGATLFFLPWRSYFSQFFSINQILAQQSWGGQSSLLTSPLAIAAGAVALFYVGRRRAAWLAVPVLWPSSQLHYSVLALPVFATSPALAMAAAVPERGVLGITLVCYVIWERRERIADFASRWTSPPDHRHRAAR